MVDPAAAACAERTAAPIPLTCCAADPSTSGDTFRNDMDGLPFHPGGEARIDTDVALDYTIAAADSKALSRYRINQTGNTAVIVAGGYRAGTVSEA